jgi:hypothetical protein
MGLFDGLLGSGGSIDVAALAGKVGLTQDELMQGGEAILAKLATGNHDASSAATAASAETGIDAGKLMALLPVLAEHLGHADQGGFMASLTGEGGLLSKLGGDGGLASSIGGIAKGIFGGKD